MDEDIEIEDKEIELHCKYTYKNKNMAQQFVTRLRVQEIFVTSREKRISRRKAPVWANLMENKLIYALPAGYDAAQRVETLSFNQVGELTVDVLWQE